MALGSDRPRRDLRKVRTRQGLISALRQLLRTTRVRDVTVRAIAEAADVGSGTFYNHFSDIDELIDAAANDALAAIEQEVMAQTEDGDSLSVILAMAFLLAWRDMEPNLVWFAFRSVVAGDDDDTLLWAQDFLQRGFERGEFRVTPKIGVFLIAGSLNAMVLATEAGLGSDETRREATASVLRQLGCDDEHARRSADLALERLTAP